MSRAKWILVTAVVVALVAACGPSIRRTYQSDNAFARCFDMDYNPARSSDEKRVCWETWLGEYVYNQPEDKVSYAELRLDEIGEGISVPGPPGPEGAFDQRPVPPEPDGGPPDEAPDEAEPEEEPPAATDAQAGDAGVTSLPQGECESMCKKSFVPCSQACAKTEGEGCAAACEAGYKACMRDCFAE